MVSVIFLLEANGLRILEKAIPAFAFILLRKLRKDICSIRAKQFMSFVKLEFKKLLISN